MSIIHPTAIVEDGAMIEDDVQIGPYSIISSKAIIKSGTKIGSHVVIDGKTTIGNNNEIFSHSVLGSIPQDLKFDGEDVELIIGNNNKIREFTLFNPGTIGGGSMTIIGDNNLFMGYVHVAHDCIIGNNCIFANCATLAGHVECEDFVVVGGLTPIHQFVKIGEFAMVAGASALNQDLPPYCMAEGNRAVLRGLNLTGLRRRIEKRSDIDELKRVYKKLFNEGLPLIDTAKDIYSNTNNEFVKKFTNFIINNKRGIPYKRIGKDNNE
jgi:UDP-N-acetylglucosamine acyltransferase